MLESLLQLHEGCVGLNFGMDKDMQTMNCVLCPSCEGFGQRHCSQLLLSRTVTATCTITWRMIVACITVYNLQIQTAVRRYWAAHVVCVYLGGVMTRCLVGLCLLGQPCMNDNKAINLCRKHCSNPTTPDSNHCSTETTITVDLCKAGPVYYPVYSVPIPFR